ncbi:MAG: hypothetical protein MHM6MM_000510 [Cercozoa sp. M6MM]
MDFKLPSKETSPAARSSTSRRSSHTSPLSFALSHARSKHQRMSEATLPRRRQQQPERVIDLDEQGYQMIVRNLPEGVTSDSLLETAIFSDFDISNCSIAGKTARLVFYEKDDAVQCMRRQRRRRDTIDGKLPRLTLESSTVPMWSKPPLEVSFGRSESTARSARTERRESSRHALHHESTKSPKQVPKQVSKKPLKPPPPQRAPSVATAMQSAVTATPDRRRRPVVLRPNLESIPSSARRAEQDDATLLSEASEQSEVNEQGEVKHQDESENAEMREQGESEEGESSPAPRERRDEIISWSEDDSDEMPPLEEAPSETGPSKATHPEADTAVPEAFEEDDELDIGLTGAIAALQQMSHPLPEILRQLQAPSRETGEPQQKPAYVVQCTTSRDTSRAASRSRSPSPMMNDARSASPHRSKSTWLFSRDFLSRSSSYGRSRSRSRSRHRRRRHSRSPSRRRYRSRHRSRSHPRLSRPRSRSHPRLSRHRSRSAPQRRRHRRSRDRSGSQRYRAQSRSRSRSRASSRSRRRRDFALPSRQRR